MKRSWTIWHISKSLTQNRRQFSTRHQNSKLARMSLESHTPSLYCLSGMLSCRFCIIFELYLSCTRPSLFFPVNVSFFALDSQTGCSDVQCLLNRMLSVCSVSHCAQTKDVFWIAYLPVCGVCKDVLQWAAVCSNGGCLLSKSHTPAQKSSWNKAGVEPGN